MPAKKKFHLAWFTNAIPHGWRLDGGGAAPWSGRDITDWMDGSFLIDMARSLDRAGFDFIMLEDHVAFGAHGYARLDPLTLMPLLADATEGLGVVATMSTSFYPPFMLARTLASLDHVTHGRQGWNIVTTSEEEAARAFGHDAQPPHQERYLRAAEYTDLVFQLWDAWAPDAVTPDGTDGKYVDVSKVKQLKFEGKYYRCEGALNIPRSPQGRPMICQAGTSERGRDFGAKYADVALVSTGGADSYDAMKEVRDDMRARAAAFGRNPDDLKVFYMITPIIAETLEEAIIARARRSPELTDEQAFAKLQGIAHIGGIDLSGCKLDEPLPFIDVSKLEGHQATFGNFYRLGLDGKRTVREVLRVHNLSSLDLFGTASMIADRMEEAMNEVGGDGFLLQCRPLTRKYIAEVVDGLVPELQKRGLVRTKYAHKLLKDTLHEE